MLVKGLVNKVLELFIIIYYFYYSYLDDIYLDFLNIFITNAGDDRLYFFLKIMAFFLYIYIWKKFFKVVATFILS